MSVLGNKGWPADRGTGQSGSVIDVDAFIEDGFVRIDDAATRSWSTRGSRTRARLRASWGSRRYE